MNMRSDSRITTLTTTDPVENEWKRLFVITEHWKSDLKFFEDELMFFRLLMDRHFSRLVREDLIDSTRATVMKLDKLENGRFKLEQKIDRHFNHMTNLIEDPFPHDAQTYRDEHAKLEKAIMDFVKDFRALKKDVFRLARQVMDGERTSHLLAH